MSQIQGFKCENCGAPLAPDMTKHEIICPYCGQLYKTLHKNAGPSSAAEAEIRLVKRKRSTFDKILIVIGTIWVGITCAAMTELHYWTSLITITAGLLLASPGIVLLLIGFRRKKPEFAHIHNGKDAPAKKVRIK